MNTTKLKLELLNKEGVGSMVSDVISYLHIVVLEEEQAEYREYAKLSQQVCKDLKQQYSKELKQKRNEK